jgi:isocitrate dehydrogenase
MVEFQTMNIKESTNRVPVSIIEGDGIGPEIMAATLQVLDAAVTKAYAGQRQLIWEKVPAGSQAVKSGNDPLPSATLESIRTNRIALKGPLTTPVARGFSSLNVQLRLELDLYACLRPVHSITGLPSPLSLPGELDVVIFRENSEDLYTSIEFPAGSSSNQKLLSILSKEFPDEYQRMTIREDVGIGLKHISKKGSQRFVRAAIRWALDHKRRKITLVHKGNIMKYTEGAFLNWAYDVAEAEFADACFTRRMFQEILKNEGSEKADQANSQAVAGGRLLIDDLIADVAFARVILQPHSFDVVVTTNLNGDYLSDAFAALVGGVGIAPGANLNPELGIGVFEANHGSADDLAGRDCANPSSLILSGAMLLDFIHWEEAADLVRNGLQNAIVSKRVTFDLARLIPGAVVLGTSAFGQAIVDGM